MAATATAQTTICQRCGEPISAPRTDRSMYCSHSCRNYRGRDRLDPRLTDEQLRELRELALDELVAAVQSDEATAVHVRNLGRLIRRCDERLATD